MQPSTTSSSELERSQLLQDQVFVTYDNTIVSWKDNYNNPFMFMAPPPPPSSSSSELNLYFENISEDDENNLLLTDNMAQQQQRLSQFKYQTPSYPCTLAKNHHSSTESIMEDMDEEGQLRVRSRSRNNQTSSSKRERTLEKNRQAASRCRQRKKEWLNQLQTNVDRLTRENRILEEQSMSLREEILNLKTILLSHRDCSQSNKPDAIDITKAVYKTH